MRKMIKRILSLHFDERGAASILTAFFLGLFGLGFAALVIDASLLYAKRSEMITSADAAALAGANYIREQVVAGQSATSTTVVDDAKQVAIDFALLNGADPAKVTVEIASKPVTIDGVTQKRQVVDVKVGVVEPNLFARFLGSNESTVMAGATATWGYIYSSQIANMLPIFVFDETYDLGGLILLHEKLEPSSNIYGFINVGSGMADIKTALGGGAIGPTIINDNILPGKPGDGESLYGPVESRFQTAATLATAQERRSHMMALVPVIDKALFDDPDTFTPPYNNYKKNGDFVSQLKLPIKYFAVFEIEDIIHKNADNGNPSMIPGSTYSLDPANEYKKVASPKLYTPSTIGDLDSNLLVGHFTGEQINARTIVEAMDQINPDPSGSEIPATYAKLIK